MLSEYNHNPVDYFSLSLKNYEIIKEFYKNTKKKPFYSFLAHLL